MNNIYLWEALLTLGFAAVCAGASISIGKRLFMNLRNIQALQSQIEGFRTKVYLENIRMQEVLQDMGTRFTDLELALKPKQPAKKSAKKAAPKKEK